MHRRWPPKSSTRLYDSQIAAVTDIAGKDIKTVKALLTFTDGEDNLSSKSSSAVVNAAAAKNVRLYNIGLGSSSDACLFDQAVATGGAFMYAQDAPQLISMFGNLSKLLDGSAKFYSIEWKMTPVNNTAIAKDTYDLVLKVLTPYNYTIDVPVSVKYQ